MNHNTLILALRGLLLLGCLLALLFAWVISAFIIAFVNPFHDGSELPCSSCYFLSTLLFSTPLGLLARWLFRKWRRQASVRK